MATQQSPRKLFIQMSGAPGSGKSTLARLLGSAITGVVIDHDVLRSAFLEARLPFDQAAKRAYDLQWALAQDVMKQSLSVIIDSTCNFQEVLDQGAARASQHDYTYWYIECRVNDIDLLDERLRARDPMTSQRAGVNRPPPAAATVGGAAGAQLDARGAGGDEDGRALFRRWIQHPCRPQDNVIIVDSTADLEVLCHQILEQIAG